MSIGIQEKQWLDTHHALVDAIERSSITHGMHRLVSGMNEQPLAELASALEAQGYRKLKFFKSGENSLLFETTENQLLRICYDHHSGHRLGNRINNPAILQPIQTFSVPVADNKKFSVSVMPMVRTQGRNWKLTKILYHTLRQCGIEVDDLMPENIGLIDIPQYGIQDLPVLIDAGAARKVPMEIDQFLLEDWIARGVEGIPDGTPWQKVFDPRIGTGKPTGVVEEETLRRLEESRGKESVIVHALREGGYGEHARRALENLDKADRLSL